MMISTVTIVKNAATIVNTERQPYSAHAREKPIDGAEWPVYPWGWRGKSRLLRLQGDLQSVLVFFNHGISFECPPPPV